MSDAINLPCEHDTRFRGVMGCRNGCLACQCEDLAAKLSAHEAGLERLRGLHERLAVNDFYAGSAVFAAVEELLGLLAASPTRQQENSK